jgi:hypothetical protein
MARSQIHSARRDDRAPTSAAHFAAFSDGEHRSVCEMLILALASHNGRLRCRMTLSGTCESARSLPSTIGNRVDSATAALPGAAPSAASYVNSSPSPRFPRRWARRPRGDHHPRTSYPPESDVLHRLIHKFVHRSTDLPPWPGAHHGITSIDTVQTMSNLLFPSELLSTVMFDEADRHSYTQLHRTK